MQPPAHDPWAGLRLPGHASGTPNTGGSRGQVRGLVHGQEAVIPLPSGGKVPVTVSMPQMPRGGGQTVQVIDQRRGGAPVTAEKSRGPDGRELVKLYVRDELQSGGFDGAMGGRFGTRARKVRRN